MPSFRSFSLVLSIVGLAFSDTTAVWEAKIALFAPDGTRTIPPDDAYFGLFSNVKPFSGLLVPSFITSKRSELDSGCLTVTTLSDVLPNSTQPWLAVVARGSCPFVQKTETAVAAGADGVIIVNNYESSDPPVMSGDPKDAIAEKITIAVTQATGDLFIDLFDENSTINVTIAIGDEVYVEPPAIDLSNWLFGHIVVFGILVLLMSFCVLGSYYCRSWVGRREQRQAQQRVTNILDQIPTRRFVPDPEQQARRAEREAEGGDESEVVLDDDTPVCAICLAEFEAEEDIRTLPCRHEYHTECCDPWIKDNHTCPLCKDDILAAMEANADKKKKKRRNRRSSAATPPATAAASPPTLALMEENDSVAIPMEDTSARHPSVQRVDSSNVLAEMAQASLLPVTASQATSGSVRSTASDDSSSSNSPLLDKPQEV